MTVTCTSCQCFKLMPIPPKCTWTRCTYHLCKCLPLANMQKICLPLLTKALTFKTNLNSLREWPCIWRVARAPTPPWPPQLSIVWKLRTTTAERRFAAPPRGWACRPSYIASTGTRGRPGHTATPPETRPWFRIRQHDRAHSAAGSTLATPDTYLGPVCRRCARTPSIEHHHNSPRQPTVRPRQPYSQPPLGAIS